MPVTLSWKSPAIGVGEQRRHDERHQHTAHGRTPDADVNAVIHGRDPQSQRGLSRGEAEQSHRDDAEPQPDDQHRGFDSISIDTRPSDINSADSP